MADDRARRVADAAREELAHLRNESFEERFDAEVEDTHRWWYDRYTPLVCDFMREELPDGELQDWRETFTALHEMMANGYATWLDPGIVTEADAWEAFDPFEHLAVVTAYTLLRPETDVLSFVPLFVRFVGYLRRQGMMSAQAADRIADGYRRAVEAVESLVDVEVYPPLEPEPRSSGHAFAPRPEASSESRRRVKKTSYLVDRFVGSRFGRRVEPALASFAVHVLVGDHVTRHGHRDWAELDVAEAAANLKANGYVPPPMVAVLAEAWHGFVDWLAAKGRMSRADAERLHSSIVAEQQGLTDSMASMAS